MRIVVLGAGAVGTVLGVSLEHGKHEVLYLVRKGRRAQLRELQLVDGRGRVRRRDAPACAEEGATLPPFEWALLCVRGEQLDEGVESLARHVRGDAAVGVVSWRLDALERVRAAHPDGPVFLIAPMFSAWSEEPRPFATVRWFSLPLTKSLLSGEGEAAADRAAVEVTAALEAVGVPAQAVPSVRRSALPMIAAGSALLAGWELSGFRASALARDKALRSLTAGAIHEAARVVRGDVEGPLAAALAGMPARAIELLLLALPTLDRGSVAAMWAQSGSKLAAQTRRALDDVVARAEMRGEAAARLRELRARLGETTSKSEA